MQSTVIFTLATLVAAVATVLVFMLSRIYRERSHQRQLKLAGRQLRERQVQSLQGWLGDDHELLAGHEPAAAADAEPTNRPPQRVARAAAGSGSVSLVRQFLLPIVPRAPGFGGLAAARRERH